MVNENKLHRTQTMILGILRRVTRARYSELLRPTELEGDRFKYHLQTLVRKNLVQKDADGLYELTAEGKEFANRLNEQTGYEIAGPKASLILLVRSKVKGQTYYLAHQRKREPFYDFWGFASTPVVRGVPVIEAAARELYKQTGITAAFAVVGTQRIIDKTPSGAILEDKLFSLLLAEVDGCPVPREWRGGASVWLTKPELLATEKHFPTTALTLGMIERGETFNESICTYTTDEY